MAQFSLSWESHKSNICSGLSALQQSGEFVDMTLAADGHHVKVHKMVMSLVSPYIRELLNSVSCQHPIIFLNKISYATLCAILEYIYTGEVLVGKDNLTELIDAAKELHIRGLEDMKLEISPSNQYSQTMQAQSNEGQPLSETGYFGKTQENDSTPNIIKNSATRISMLESSDIQTLDDTDHHTYDDETYVMDTTDNNTTSNIFTHKARSDSTVTRTKEPSKGLDTQIQYTISNQGALQMILNRYMYYLRYTSRKEQLGHRSWKCINYTKKGTQCPATVITRDDVVIKRFGAHNHEFHDKKILRKVRDNAVFSALTEAEQKGHSLKSERQGAPPGPRKEGEVTTDAE